MVSREIKSRVAQNCEGYNPRYGASMMTMGSVAESCDGCSNFVRGRCIKDLFDPLVESMRIN